MPSDNSKRFIGNVFVELPSVDSTNNYAIAKVRQEQAFHGNVYFAHEQYDGKGQLGKKWTAAAGDNITMSIVLHPDFLLPTQQFALSVCMAVACVGFLNNYDSNEFYTKWPNDLYWHDR